MSETASDPMPRVAGSPLRGAGPTLRGAGPMLRVAGVHKRFRRDEVLKGIDI